MCSTLRVRKYTGPCPSCSVEHEGHTRKGRRARERKCNLVRGRDVEQQTDTKDTLQFHYWFVFHLYLVLKFPAKTIKELRYIAFICVSDCWWRLAGRHSPFSHDSEFGPGMFLRGDRWKRPWTTRHVIQTIAPIVISCTNIVKAGGIWGKWASRQRYVYNTIQMEGE